MKKFATLALVGAALIAAGCSSSADGPVATIEVKAVGMGFEPKQLTVAKGERVKVTFANTDGLLHDWEVRKLPARVHKSTGDDHGHAGGGVHVGVEPGKVGSVEFTPTRSGTYEVLCTVPGHKEAGMVGTLTVK